MKSGGITSRLSGDIDSVNNLVNLALINPAIALVRVVLTIAIIFWISPKLAAISLIFLPPLAGISFVWLKRVRPIYRSMREDRSAIDARVTETFDVSTAWLTRVELSRWTSTPELTTLMSE